MFHSLLTSRSRGVTLAEMTALERAIKLAGGLTSLANRIGVTPQVVANWRKRGSIPPDRVLQIERATEDQNGRPRVLRTDLRPDLYPEDEAA